MLNIYLKRAGVVSGPRSKHTSHSGLERIKNYMLCVPQFKGGEAFLLFGNGVHEPFLKQEYEGSYASITDEERFRVDVMLKKLRAHPIVKSLMKDAVCEEKFIVKLQGVLVAAVLDIKQPKLKRGSDLKTTVCKTLKEFIEKAILYGYIRQGVTYVLAASLKHFYFIGVQKHPPHNVFILDLNNHKDDVAYAHGELDFLLYFYMAYGKFIEGESLDLLQGEQTNTVTTMAKTGKEEMAHITQALKDHKQVKKEIIVAQKAVDKSSSHIKKLIDKFPKKEKELYQEKLDAILAAL